MRPLELTLEGFRSHEQRVTFDWRERRLVGIVGPIGAGKSSILDAVAFALYGKTPAIGSDTRGLIHQRSERAIVELVFEVDGQRWRAVRGQVRRGQPPTQLTRIDDGGEPLETPITGRAAMNATVERLLGLPFEAFCRSVLLAQNQFSEFLKATPSDRDKVLKGVFGLEVIDGAHAEAKGRLDALGRDLQDFDRRLREVEGDRARLAAAKVRAKEARTRLATLKRAEPPILELERLREAATRAEEASMEQMRTADLAAERLPGSKEVEEMVSAAEGVGRGESEAVSRVAAEEKAGRAAAAALAKVREKTGGGRVLAETRALLARAVEQERAVAGEAARLAEAVSRRDASRKGLAAAEAKLEASAAAARAAEEGSAAAADASDRAMRELEGARHAEMALTLRKGLKDGDRCPVCDRPVHALPRAKDAPSLTGAERAAERANRKVDSATAKARAAAEAAAGSRRDVEAAKRELQMLEREVGAAKGSAETASEALAPSRASLVSALGKGDHQKTLASAEKALSDAEEAVRASAERTSEARAALDVIRRSVADNARSLQGLASRLSSIGGQLGQAREVSVAPASLRSATARLNALISKRRTEAERSLTRAREQTASIRASWHELLESLDVDPDVGFEAALREADVAHRTSQLEASALAERIASASEIDDEIRAARERRDTVARLVEDLTASRFLRYLLEEERAELAVLGSEHLESLTAGRYRFTEDGSFDIVDVMSAGTTRKADSLSGGETFLASLALALALAEMVARGGGRLDAFFLDEGFGSLDAEHLDLAMEGVERLVAGSERRLVVIVSHVPEMRERIEDLITLDKDPSTGATVVVSGASRG